MTDKFFLQLTFLSTVVKKR